MNLPLGSTIEEILIYGTITIILLVCGLYVVLYLRKTLKTNEEVTQDEQLLRFSKMFEGGEISKDEYRLIKMRFARTMQEQDQVERPSQVGGGGSGQSIPVLSHGQKSRKQTENQLDRNKMLRSLLGETEED